MDLNKLIDWQKESQEDRIVEINIRKGGLRIWVYDYNLLFGTYVSGIESVTEIDLKSLMEKKEKEELDLLKKKYEA